MIYNFDFLSFCKFPFGANLGAEKYLRKYEKSAQQHVCIPNGCIISFNMNKKMRLSIVAWIYLCMFYALCEGVKNKYLSIKLVFRLIFHKNQLFFASWKNWNRPQNRTNWNYKKKWLVSEKVIYFTFTLHKTSKIEQIKPHFFYHFLPLKCYSLQRKRVKCFLGLINSFFVLI